MKKLHLYPTVWLVMFLTLALGTGCSGDDPASPAPVSRVGGLVGEWSLSLTDAAKNCVGPIGGGSNSIRAEVVEEEGAFDVIINGADVFPGDATGPSTLVFVGVDGNDTSTLTLTLNDQGTAVTGTLTNLVGNPSTCTQTWNITGVPFVAPAFSVASASPGNGSINMSRSVHPSVTFSVNVNPSTVTATSFQLRLPNQTVVAGTRSVLGKTITFTPSAQLAASTVYTIRVEGTVQDENGTSLGALFTASFTTEAQAVMNLVSVSPANSSTNAALDTNIRVVFDRNVSAASVNGTTFQVRDPSNALVSGNLSVAGAAATFNPTVDLSVSSTYSVKLTNGIQGTDGSVFSAGLNSTFRTIDPLILQSMSPANGASGVLVDAPLVLTFNKFVKISTANGTNIRLTPNKDILNSRDQIVCTYTVSGSTITIRPQSGSWQEYETTFYLDIFGLTGTNNEPLQFVDRKSFTTAFFDPGYYYTVVNFGNSQHLEYYSNTWEAYLDGTSPTDAGYWRFRPASGGHLMTSRWTGASTRALEGGDGVGRAFMAERPNGGTGWYTGQVFHTTNANPRNSGTQGALESPSIYWLSTDFQPDKTLKWDGSYIVMDTQTRLVYKMWWFKRQFAASKQESTAPPREGSRD